MERCICNISKLEHINHNKIRKIRQIRDVQKAIYDNKRRWAGHIARMKDNRWTARVTDWYPRKGKRYPGRPPTRWVDPINKTLGNQWRREAQDRENWKLHDLHLWRQS